MNTLFFGYWLGISTFGICRGLQACSLQVGWLSVAQSTHTEGQTSHSTHTQRGDKSLSENQWQPFQPASQPATTQPIVGSRHRDLPSLTRACIQTHTHGHARACKHTHLHQLARKEHSLHHSFDFVQKKTHVFVAHSILIIGLQLLQSVRHNPHT